MLDLEPKFSEDEMALATFLKTYHEICTSYPKINPQNHLRTILRNKGDVLYADPYSWPIKKLLKRTKDYYNEMLLSGYQADTDNYDDENNEFEYKRAK